MTKAVQSAVQAIAVFVGGDMDNLPVQREPGTADAVGVAANHGAHAVGVALIVLHCGISQNHVHHAALAVRHKQFVDDGGIAQDVNLHLLVGEHSLPHGAAVGGFSEIADHDAHLSQPPDWGESGACSRS